MLLIILHFVLGMLTLPLIKYCMATDGYSDAKQWKTFVSTYNELIVVVLIVICGFVSFITVGIMWFSQIFNKFKQLGNKKLPWAKEN